MTQVRHSRKASAFSLIELLTVIAIIAVLAVLTIGAFNQMGQAGNLTKAGSEIADIFENARAYAMAHNTYTWVGIRQESDDKILVATVASRDGKAIPVSNAVSVADSDLLQIDRMKQFENIRVEDLPASASHRFSGDGVTSFSGMNPPILSFEAGAGNNKKLFDSCVVQFNSRGETRILPNEIRKTIEIGLQSSTHGNVHNPENYVAIHIGGLTGAVSTHRP